MIPELYAASLRSQTVAPEGFDEHWSSHEAEAILHQLASAFVASSPASSDGPERRRAPRKSAQRGEPEFETALPLREAGLIMSDDLGVIASAGGAVNALFGFSAEELNGTQLASYFLGGVPTESRRVLGLRRDGTPFTAGVTVAPILGSRLTQFAIVDLNEERAHARRRARGSALSRAGRTNSGRDVHGFARRRR